MKPCGTEAAYRRHKYRREPACNPCLDAHRRYNRLRLGLPEEARPLLPHGTYAAWMRHYRERSSPCSPCVDALARYRRAS